MIKTLSTNKEKEAAYLLERLKMIDKEKRKNQKEKSQKKRIWKEKWKKGMMRRVQAKWDKEKQINSKRQYAKRNSQSKSDK